MTELAVKGRIFAVLLQVTVKTIKRGGAAVHSSIKNVVVST